MALGRKGLVMKISELVGKLQLLDQNLEIFVAEYIRDENAEPVDTIYCEVDLFWWDDSAKDIAIIGPGQLISG